MFIILEWFIVTCECELFVPKLKVKRETRPKRAEPSSCNKYLSKLSKKLHTIGSMSHSGYSSSTSSHFYIICFDFLNSYSLFHLIVVIYLMPLMGFWVKRGRPSCCLKIKDYINFCDETDWIFTRHSNRYFEKGLQ